MLNGAPFENLGLANERPFLEVIETFVKQARTSPEDPSLLLMDTHCEYRGFGLNQKIGSDCVNDSSTHDEQTKTFR